MKQDILYEGLTAEQLRPEARVGFAISQDAERAMADAQSPVSIEAYHLEDVLVEPNSYSPSDILDQVMLRDDAAAFFAPLSEIERIVLTMKFGIDNGREKTQREIGQEIGKSISTVRKIEKRALAKLRSSEEPKHLSEYL